MRFSIDGVNYAARFEYGHNTIQLPKSKMNLLRFQTTCMIAKIIDANGSEEEVVSASVSCDTRESCEMFRGMKAAYAKAVKQAFPRAQRLGAWVSFHNVFHPHLFVQASKLFAGNSISETNMASVVGGVEVDGTQKVPPVGVRAGVEEKPQPRIPVKELTETPQIPAGQLVGKE